MFLKDLPYTLTKPMFGEYEAKCAELRRWAAHSKNKKMQRYLKRVEELEYIFALGIYYRYIVAPFSGTTEFLDRVSPNGGGGLRLGGRALTSEYRSSVRSAVTAFNRIASEFGLTETFFAETEVKRIVSILVELEERRQHERR